MILNMLLLFPNDKQTLFCSSAGVVCDLCHHHQPSVYCGSDSAFLCLDCDHQVHTANFLVARHVRVSICKSYHSHCHDDDDDDDVLSSSSSSSSTVCSNVKRTTSAMVGSSGSDDWKTREVLVSWWSRLGGSSSSSNSSRVIEVARHGFRVWWANRLEWAPYRVGLAASLWLGFTKQKMKRIGMRRRLLKRLEEISGVPAKSIVLEQSKLAKTMKYKHQHQYQESWAEC
ncbi:hypothetical protein QVD17_02739 [Tagetes erecta]|uniref:B box-type domain-containing protein n=1 Tax=Tagetes erecta TaxID=13708 RepID=A0AAD8L759_TARER|nr:hypothetical protein QVD17_02739 [Tagetes erecta]